MKFNKFFLFLALSILSTSFQVMAEEASVNDKKITLRALVGPAFYSGTDPVSQGLALGADLDMLVSGNFGVGVSFATGKGSKYTYTSGNNSTDTDQSTSTFGLRGFYKVSRSFVTASIGPIIGVIANSSSTRVSTTGSGTTTNPAVSTTQFAVGFGASIDIAIIGPLALTVSPSILQGIGGTTNMTVINAMGGLSFNF